MRPIKQEHFLGCAVACVAFMSNISYQEALLLFEDGENKASYQGFYCKEIVNALKKTGLSFEWVHIKNKTSEIIDKPNTIVFIKKSKKYPSGHYLCRKRKKWMNPWVNFPELNVKASFTRELPGDPQYAIVRLP